MNRAELTKTVALREDIPRSTTERIVRSVFDEIEASLKSRQSITLSGFGTFRVDLQPACTRRNPQTGEPVDVPARYKARFRASDGLNASLQ